MPQLVLARTSWSSAETGFCSATLDEWPGTSFGDDVSAVTGTVYIKAVTDHKYDGLQLRDFTVTLVRRRRRDDAVDVLRETALQLPVTA